MNKIVNLRNARHMLQRYEKFLAKEKSYGNFNASFIKETGEEDDNLLCLEIYTKIPNFYTEAGEPHCIHCVWSLTEEVFNLPNRCTEGHYEKLLDTTDYEQGKKLLTERITMLKELIKKAESKK